MFFLVEMYSNRAKKASVCEGANVVRLSVLVASLFLCFATFFGSLAIWPNHKMQVFGLFCEKTQKAPFQNWTIVHLYIPTTHETQMLQSIL